MPPAFSTLAPAGVSTGQAPFGVNVAPKGLGFLPRLDGPGIKQERHMGTKRKGGKKY
jgi:hypothetical protein